MDNKELCARHAIAAKKKDLWKTLLESAYEYAMPMQNPYHSSSSPDRLIDRMYESTAMQSVFRLANRMLLELVPPEQIWFDMKPGPVVEMENLNNKKALEELDEYLSKVVKIMGVVFSSGSFVSAMHESLIDLIVAGIGAMLVLESPSSDNEPVIFESVPQHEVSIECKVGGGLSGVYRMRKDFQVMKIQKTWTDAKLPQGLSDMIKPGKDAKAVQKAKVDLSECTYYDDKKKLWIYKVLWTQEGKDPSVIVERDYTQNPWIVYRWSKIPGHEYGPGPVMLTLPDIRTGNAVMEMLLKNAALALSGTYMVADDGVLNPDNIVISNGSLIPVARTGGSLGASIAPLPTGRNFDVGQVVLDDMRMQIKKGLLDNALPPLEGNVRSATEIIQRVRELTREFGGAIGRLINELIFPLVRRVADILSNRGYINPINIDQYLVRVQVNSPLAQSQQMQEVERVLQWLEIVMQIGGPEQLELAAKIEEILPWVADKLGVPSELVRDQDERTAKIEQMQQEMLVQQAVAANVNVAPAQGVPVAAAAQS